MSIPMSNQSVILPLVMGYGILYYAIRPNPNPNTIINTYFIIYYTILYITKLSYPIL